MRRLQVVDLVRSVAVLVVLAIHLGSPYVPQHPHWHPLDYLWYKIWVMGNYGVSLFFVVSGFLITRLIADSPGGLFQPNLRSFYTRRVARLYPLLLAVVLTGCLAAWLFRGPSQPYRLCFNSSDLLGPGLWLSIATFSMNWYKTWMAASHPYQFRLDFGLHWDVLWTLSVEEQFYFFYPLILRHLKNERNLAIFLVWMAALGQFITVLNHVLYPHYFSWNSFPAFGLISMGCLLYLASVRLGPFLREDKRASGLLCLLGFLLLVWTYFHSPAKVYVVYSLIGHSLIGVGAFLFLLGGFHLDFFESKSLAPFALPGKLSYGLYLLNTTVLFFLWGLLGKLTDFPAFGVFAGVSVLLAYLSFRFYETPLNARVRRLLDPNPSPQARAFPGNPLKKGKGVF